MFSLSWEQSQRVLKTIIKQSNHTEFISVPTDKPVTIRSAGFPNGYERNLLHDWIITTEDHSHLMVKFDVVDLETLSRRCMGDKVIVYDQNEKGEWSSLGEVCRQNDTEMTFSGSKAMKLTFRTDYSGNRTGFAATARSVCGGRLTDPDGIIKLNRLTSDEITCTWNISVKPGKRIEITFLNFSFTDEDQHSSDMCSSNYVILKEGFELDAPIIGGKRFCGSQGPNKTILTNGNRLSIVTSNSLLGGHQVLELQYLTYSNLCTQSVYLSKKSLTSLIITSPNYPNMPPANSECTWQFLAPTGETIHVQFLERFDLAYSSNCEKEYVEVRDGGTELSPSVGKYCYSMPPPQVLSEGNALFIKYYTNVEFPNNGFKAKISLARCGGTYHSFSYDDIKSPDYPKAYERDLNCVWHFIADDTELFTFEFLKLNLGEFKGHYKNNPCNSSIADSLTITGTSKGSNIVNTYLLCGENITVPEPILANDVIVNFTSVSSSIYTQKFTKTAKLGFHLTLMATKPSCSEVIELSHGEIQTPKYPSIPTTQFCSWRITVPPGRRVTLNVSDFEVVDTLTRFSVALWVYNDFLYTSLLARWNHSVPSGTTISSSGNEMMIYIFHLNGSSRRGFRGYFSSEKRSLCQTNELANTNGEIQVDMTQPYYCQWTVQPKKTNMSTTAFTIVGNLGEHFESGLCRRLRFYYEEMLGSRFCGVAERKSPFTFITPYLSTIIKAFTAIDDDGAVSNVSYSISWKNNECGGVFDSNLDVVRIASPTTSDGKYPANSDCVWILSYPEETALKITFNSLDLEIADSEKDCGDYLAIHGGLRPSSPRLLKVCGAVLPSDIITKSNSLWIQFHSDDSHELKGFDLTISVAHEACGGLFHGTYGTFSSENHPQQYRNNSNCIYEMLAPIGYIIQLTFADRFYIEESSDCSKDYVEVIDYVKHEWKTVGKFCGRSLPKPINSTSNRLRVRFKSDETTEGDGFFARWTVGCGGTFDAREPGVIHSPGYPDTYTHNLICNYTFTAPDNNKLLYGIFEDFELEKRSAAGCDTDTVDIYVRRYPYRTIKSLKLDGTYCGNSAPPKIQSFGMFTVIFRSDSWQEFKGFRLKYGLEECGGNITEPTVIQIPKAERFPLSFRSLLQECRWNVTAPVGQIVVIKVQQILLSTVGQCSQDFVKIWDGGYAAANNSNLLATLCGQTNGREALYRTSSEKAFIRFFSRNYFTFKAFAAEVSFMHGPKVGCGGFINLGEDKETVIKNPDLDKDGKYDDLMECLWTISVPRDLTVSATFQTLDIDNCTNPGNKMCHCDYVEIYDGMDENFERIRKYCGSSLPETVRSSRSYMAIKFSSDSLTNRAGFKIAVKGVQSPCGVRFLNVTENWQTLTSPSYPNNYPPDTHCSWLLMGGYGYMVIHIEEVDIEDSVACSKDSLKIRDFRFSGRFTNGSPENPSQKIYLGIQNEQNMNPTIFQGSKFSYSTSMFCGKRKGMDYYSSTNNVLIKFKSSSAQTSKGFKLKYSLLGCSRNFTFPQGRYKITNNRKNCITTIVAPNPNSTISLYFSELIIFSWTFNPNRDAVLKVYDGLNVKNPNALLASLVGSGRRTPDPIFSNSSQVTLVISPVSSSISFDITYTTTTAGRGCGGSIFNYGGVFTSPMYPMNLRNYTSCRWDVSVPHGNAIELQFTEFDLGPKQTCASDYVQIYDVDPSDGSESLQTTYCGNDSPAKYIGMKGQIAVKYVTSIHNGGRGWVARFMSRAIDSSMPAFTTMHLIN